MLRDLRHALRLFIQKSAAMRSKFGIPNRSSCGRRS
jgi:hypothetical protein